MRKILFKAKTVATGEWVEGWLIESFTGITYIVTCFDHILSTIEKYEVDPETICQYTGLTDKKGSKIWENDIIKDKYLKYHVIWDEEEGCWMQESVSGARYSVAGIGRINGEIFEVIGTIFDNPKLIKND